MSKKEIEIDTNLEDNAVKVEIKTEEGKEEQVAVEDTPEVEATEVDQVKEQLQQSQDQLRQMQDKYIRLLAEFDNFKKRNARFREDFIKTASKDLMLELLPVLDDFERAFKASPDIAEDSGFQLIYNKLKSNLSAKGLEPMETIGQPFDPEFHEALTKIPAPSDDMKGKVIDEIEKGYYLKGVILRYARVVIGE